jgi:heme/copper-type cytochrome/quinol oxidase subunit 2
MKIKTAALAVLFITALPNIARACAVCFSDGDDAVGRAFNWSIVFLMAAPYLVVGSIAGCLLYFYRRAAKRSASQKESDEPPAGYVLNQEESGR